MKTTKRDNNKKDIMVMKVLTDDMLTVLKLKKGREESYEGPTHQELKRIVQDGKLSNNPDIAPYANIWKEFTVEDGVVLQRKRIVFPDNDPREGSGTLRQ